MVKNSHCLFTCQVQGCCYRFPSISVPSSVSGEKTSIHFINRNFAKAQPRFLLKHCCFGPNISSPRIISRLKRAKIKIGEGKLIKLKTRGVGVLNKCLYGEVPHLGPTPYPLNFI